MNGPFRSEHQKLRRPRRLVLPFLSLAQVTVACCSLQNALRVMRSSPDVRRERRRWFIMTRSAPRDASRPKALNRASRSITRIPCRPPGGLFGTIEGARIILGERKAQQHTDGRRKRDRNQEPDKSEQVAESEQCKH